MSKTALLFAGQGAQVVGMARDLHAAFPTARTLAAQADDRLGYSLSRICFEGPEPDLTRTENAQPGIFLASWIALELLREAIPTLDYQATAGLSLGEFTALAAAGSFSFADGLQLVRLRGRFMQEACEASRGGMAAVLGLEEAATRRVCDQAGVELANLNCPGQLVISGAQEGIAQAVDLAKAAGAKRVIPLPVAGAYHSRLMAPAQPRLRQALASIPIQAPHIPVISNVTAKPHTSPQDIVDTLVRQVTASVLWELSVRHLLDSGFQRFIELGPGTALSGFVKRITKDAQVLNVSDVPSLEATVRACG